MPKLEPFVPEPVMLKVVVVPESAEDELVLMNPRSLRYWAIRQHLN